MVGGLIGRVVSVRRSGHGDEESRIVPEFSIPLEAAGRVEGSEGVTQTIQKNAGEQSVVSGCTQSGLAPQESSASFVFVSSGAFGTDGAQATAQLPSHQSARRSTSLTGGRDRAVSSLESYQYNARRTSGQEMRTVASGGHAQAQGGRGLPYGFEHQTVMVTAAEAAAAAKRAGAGETGKAATTVKWKEYLQVASERQARELRSEVAQIHRDNSRMDLTPCLYCNNSTCTLELVTLQCFPERRPQTAAYDAKAVRPPHSICFSCITHLVKKQHRFLAKQIEKEREAKEDITNLQWLHGSAIKILPCPICKSPNVMTVHTAFNEGLSRKRIEMSGATTQYQVHFAATKVLSDNFSIEEVYENERRPLFGTFSSNNMLALDWRGSFSNGGGSAVEQSKSVKPNRAWLWLETHSPDVTLPRSGVGGWQYHSLAWPSDPMEYSADVSLFHFVRRRRLLHTRIRMSHEVLQQLSLVEADLARTGKIGASGRTLADIQRGR